jgi:pentapeptide MXKDX repeat protein
MNAYRMIFAAMLISGIATAANAQGMAAPKDGMAKDSMAKSDGMAAPKDGMAMAKPMKHGSMKHDAMKQDGMKHDAMKHDSMKSDSMATPAH